MTIYQIAEICHEANRAYCRVNGDGSQLPWEEAPEWQRAASVTGVELILENPDTKPSACHESWLEKKQEAGWKYGPVKDHTRLEHPCCVPYADLPLEQQAKDYLFSAVVKSLRMLVATE